MYRESILNYTNWKNYRKCRKQLKVKASAWAVCGLIRLRPSHWFRGTTNQNSLIMLSRDFPTPTHLTEEEERKKTGNKEKTQKDET